MNSNVPQLGDSEVDCCYILHLFDIIIDLSSEEIQILNTVMIGGFIFEAICKIGVPLHIIADNVDTIDKFMLESMDYYAYPADYRFHFADF